MIVKYAYYQSPEPTAVLLLEEKDPPFIPRKDDAVYILLDPKEFTVPKVQHPEDRGALLRRLRFRVTNIYYDTTNQTATVFLV